MKVMGSALLVFQAIVLGLAIPVSLVIYNVDKSFALWSTFALMILCVLAVGGVRRDRRTAIFTGVSVQILIIGVGFFNRPLLFPGILFALIWAMAINLSAKTDAAIQARAQQAQSGSES